MIFSIAHVLLMLPLVHGVADILKTSSQEDIKTITKTSAVVSQSYESLGSVAQTLATAQVTTSSDKMKTGFVNLVKRQDQLEAGVRAVIDYSCPRTGSQTRSFKWKVEFHRAHDDLRFRPMENVNAWDHFTRVTNDFGTYWYDRYCEMQGEHCCVYTVKAQTLGEIFADHMTLTMTTSLINAAEEPKVTQVCFNVAGEHCAAQCPVHDIYFDECTVNAILLSHF